MARQPAFGNNALGNLLNSPIFPNHSHGDTQGGFNPTSEPMLFKRPTFSAIVARDLDNNIGFQKSLPWHGCDQQFKSACKADMDWFVSKTTNKVIVMGSNTFDSIGRKALKDRQTVVIGSRYAHTSQDQFGNGVLCIPTPNHLFDMIHHLSEKKRIGDPEIMVIGGAAIYETFAPYLDRIYLSTIKTRFQGDLQLHIDLSAWNKVFMDSTQDKNLDLEIYERATFITSTKTQITGDRS